MNEARTSPKQSQCAIRHNTAHPVLRGTLKWLIRKLIRHFRNEKEMEPKRPRTQTSLFRCAHKGRREGDNGLRPPSVPFPWSLAVHHQSLAFRARLCHAKNEAPEEEAGAEMRPAVVSGIVTRDAPVSYCSSFFPVPSNNPRSLYKTQLVLETVNPFEIKFNNELTIVTSFSCTSFLFQ